MTWFANLKGRVETLESNAKVFEETSAAILSEMRDIRKDITEMKADITEISASNKKTLTG